MAQSRIVLICMVALVLALGAAFVARGLAAPRRPAPVLVAAPPPKPTLRVLVARHDLAVGDVVGPDSVTWQPWPADGLNPRFIVNGAAAPVAPGADARLAAAARSAAEAARSAVTGDLGPAAPLMGSVVRQAIAANEPVLASKLVKGGAGGVMAVTLDPGMRAMSVPITAESAAGGFILPGDHVDVVQARKLSAPGAGETAVTAAAVLNNVRVLAIDQNTRPADKAAAVVGAVGTLEVTPGQAERLVQARAQGDLTLVLRSYADAQGPTTEGAAQAAADGTVHVFRSGQATDVKVAPMTRSPLRLLARAALLAGACAAPVAAAAQPVLAGAPLRPSPAPRLRYAPPSDDTPPSAFPLADAGRGGTVRVGTGAGAVRQLTLPRGRSATIDLPVDARDVLVSNPGVADVALSTPRRIYVMGTASGQTDATFVDGVGRQILRLDIRVDQDPTALQQTLNRLLPGSAVHVEAANDSLILSGEAASAAEADKAARLAAAFVHDPRQVVNMIAVAGAEQVMLRVKIVEVNRTVIKQLGFDLSSVIGQLGGPQYLFSKAATYGVAGALLGGLQAGYNYDSTKQPFSSPVVCPTPSTCVTQPEVLTDRNYKLSQIQPNSLGTRGVNQANSTLQAFERVGLVRTLAEPNLTAISGESANFLAGGEFPVPVGEDNNGRVTVEFKQYGVGLGFTPVVLSNGRISLKISTEVSEITNIGGFTLNTSSTTGASTSAPSLVIPGLNVRRAQTVVELPSGGAMAIAGLMQSVTRQTLDSLPGLMQLPVLGALFRSRDFQQDESELVVIVTPYLVKPARPDQLSTPADGLVIADDLQTDLLGKLNVVNKTPPAAVAGKTYQGPYGYVVD